MNDSDNNFMIDVNKKIVMDVLKICSTNWENPLRGVPDLCLDSYKHMLAVIRAGWRQQDDCEIFIQDLLDETMKLRWSQKAKYSQLNALIPAIGVGVTMSRYSDLPTGLATSLSSNHLTNAGVEVNFILFILASGV